MMKQPVHSVKKVQDQVLVMRLIEPRFHAFYNPDTQELQHVQFEGRKDYPGNADSLLKKAKAAAKHALATNAQ